MVQHYIVIVTEKAYYFLYLILSILLILLYVCGIKIFTFLTMCNYRFRIIPKRQLMIKSPTMKEDEKVIFLVKVLPRSSKSEIVGWEGDILRVRLHAIPEKGKANQELIALLAKKFKVPKRAVEILQGETSRLKRVSIDGLDPQMLVLLGEN